MCRYPLSISQLHIISAWFPVYIEFHKRRILWLFVHCKDKLRGTDIQSSKKENLGDLTFIISSTFYFSFNLLGIHHQNLRAKLSPQSTTTTTTAARAARREGPRAVPRHRMEPCPNQHHSLQSPHSPSHHLKFPHPRKG